MRTYILVFSILFSSYSMAAGTNFTFEGKPIHPACVALFNSHFAKEHIGSIILNNCQLTEISHQNTFQRNDYNEFYWNNKNSSDGFYGYKVIGKTTHHVYVLDTQFSGGGSGVFSTILFVKLVPEKFFIFNPNQPRTETVMTLQLLGMFVGGDRCSGGYNPQSLVLDHWDRLTLDRYADNLKPTECNSWKKITLDLKEIQ